MSQDFKGAQQGAMKDEVKQAIIQLGLDYRLMTRFTSFVAVEEMIVTDGGQPRRIDVPVEVPEGVNREAVFGQERQIENLPINSRSLSSFSLMAPGSVAAAQTVTVTRSGSDAAKAKPAGAGGSGAGTGPGQAGNTGGGTQSSANTIHGEPPAPKSTPSSGPTGLLTVSDGLSVDRARTLSPEEQKRADLQSKFHPSVLAVIDRLKDQTLKPNSDEAKFIHNGKAEIQIWLTEKSDETLAKLKQLGFEVVLDPKTARLVIGRLPIEKLAALAELKSVRYVAPQLDRN